MPPAGHGTSHMPHPPSLPDSRTRAPPPPAAMELLLAFAKSASRRPLIPPFPCLEYLAPSSFGSGKTCTLKLQLAPIPVYLRARAHADSEGLADARKLLLWLRGTLGWGQGARHDRPGSVPAPLVGPLSLALMLAGLSSWWGRAGGGQGGGGGDRPQRRHVRRGMVGAAGRQPSRAPHPSVRRGTQEADASALEYLWRLVSGWCRGFTLSRTRKAGLTLRRSRALRRSRVLGRSRALRRSRADIEVKPGIYGGGAIAIIGVLLRWGFKKVRPSHQPSHQPSLQVRPPHQPSR